MLTEEDSLTYDPRSHHCVQFAFRVGWCRQNARAYETLGGGDVCGGAITGRALADVLYNLPVLLAFDVLTQTLLAMRDEGTFACPRNQLGPLMDSAQTAV